MTNPGNTIKQIQRKQSYSGLQTSAAFAALSRSAHGYHTAHLGLNRSSFDTADPETFAYRPGRRHVSQRNTATPGAAAAALTSIITHSHTDQ